MAMMSKIIEIPIADKNNAEKVVNEQLAAISGIVNVQALDERRVIVFYNGSGSTPGTGDGGGSTPGTGDDEGGGEDPGDDPGTGGGEDPGDDPGTGGGEDPGDDPGTGGGSEDTEEYDYPVVPLEEDPWEGKFGEYAFAVRYDWPAAVAHQPLANFGELGQLMQDECDKLWNEQGEEEYLHWLEDICPYELYVWQVTADVGKYDTDHYDVLLKCYTSKTQVATAPGPFNMAEGSYTWDFEHGEEGINSSGIRLGATFGTPTSVVLIRRAVKKSS